MKLSQIILITFLFTAVLSLSRLKGNEVGKDYAIGNITHLYFIQGEKVIFKSQETFGTINDTTGQLKHVFQLDQDEEIVFFGGAQEIAIAKNKSINVFFPKDQKLIRLQISDFLEKEEFSKILSFTRWRGNDIVMTDKFIAKNSNDFFFFLPENANKTEGQYGIIFKFDEPKENFVSIITKFQRQGKEVLNDEIGVASWYKQGEKVFVCIRLLGEDDTVKKDCGQIKTQSPIIGVANMGNHYFVALKNEGSFILNEKLQVLQQMKPNSIATYAQQLKIYGGDTSKNLNIESKEQTVFMMTNNDRFNRYQVQISPKVLIVKRQGKIIAEIEKDISEIPYRIWGDRKGTLGFRQTPKLQVEVKMYVYYQSGNIVCYDINQFNKTAKVLWQFHIVDSKLDQKDIKIEEVKVTIEQEEEIFEEQEKEGDIQQGQKKPDPKASTLPPKIPRKNDSLIGIPIEVQPIPKEAQPQSKEAQPLPKADEDLENPKQKQAEAPKEGQANNKPPN